MRLLFTVNVDWFFLSHRLPIALAAARRGFDVWVAAADSGRGSEIRAHGLNFVPIPFSRMGREVTQEIRVFIKLVRVYRSLRPDIVHHVSIKPVVVGSLAARIVKPQPAVVNAISGLGFLFSEAPAASRLRRVLLPLYRMALRHSRGVAIFQNLDDLAAFVAADLINRSRSVVIRGSGVDCDQFVPREIPPGSPIVMLASRMLVDKGVRDFVQAGRIVRRDRPDVRFVLVGPADDPNPTAITSSELQTHVNDGTVEWWGQRVDMPAVLSEATIVVLPTYREGLPKVLIEAAACGRPIVATDVPGCREVVQHGVNGLLVPPRDPDSLAGAIAKLLGAPEVSHAMGKEGRRAAVAKFAEPIVVDETLRLYDRLLSS